jgi:hypothetical protein
MATSRFSRTAALIAASPLLNRLTESLRQGRTLTAISPRDDALITAGQMPATEGFERRYALASGEGAAGRILVLSSARSAALSFLEEVGEHEASQSLAVAERQLADSGNAVG